MHFRLSQPVLRRRKYFQGRSIRGGDVKDVAWLAPDGREMNDEAWNADFVRSLGMLLSGNAIEEVDERGEPIVGDTLLVLLNAHTDEVPFTLPALDARSAVAAGRSTRSIRDAPSAAFKPGGQLSAAGPVGRRLQGHAAAARAAPRRRRRAQRRAAPSRRRADAAEPDTGAPSTLDDRPADAAADATPAPRADDDPLWYKDAIIYQAHVKSFFDSNNDGIGDFPGLTQKLDYLQGLGITCLWLLPFFPSPLKDDGYDIADYLNVHPSYGTLDDFKAFVARGARAAHQGAHRAGRQPHLRPASVVPARAAGAAGIARARVLRLERHRQEVSRDADHLQRYREVELDLRSGRRSSTTGTASSRISPISTTTTRPSSTRSST